MTLDGQTAYLSSSLQGVLSYDLSDPEHPVLLDRLSYVPLANLSIYRGMVCGNNKAVLHFIDPVSREVQQIAGHAYETYSYCLIDTLCFISDSYYEELDGGIYYRYSNLMTFGITDLRSPNLLNRLYYDSHGMGYDIGSTALSYQSGYLYAACWTGGISTWDVRDPDTARYVALVDAVFSPNMVISNNELIVFNDNLGFKVFSLDNPAEPELLLTIDTLEIRYGTAEDSLVYLAQRNHSIAVWNIANINQPEVIGELGLNNEPLFLTVSGDIGLALARNNELYVLDVSDPASPSLGSSILGRAGTIRNSWKHGDLLYTLVDNLGLIISDCSNPNRLEELSCTPIGRARGMAVSGQYAFVPIVQQGVQIIDISDPAQPDSIGLIRPNLGNLFDVAVKDNALYIAGYNGVGVYDISNSRSPRLVRNLNAPPTYKLEVVDTLLVCQHWRTASVYSITNSQSPQVRGPYQPIFDGEDRIVRQTVVNGRLFLQRYWEWSMNGDVFATGLAVDVIDITRPDSLRMLGTLDRYQDIFPATLTDFFEADSCLGVIFNGALLKFDFNGYPGRNLRPLGVFSLETPVEGPVFIDDEILYINNPGRIDIYDARPLDAPLVEENIPSSFALSAFPNPFNSSTTITFTVQQASQPVRLTIYDLQGRLVADLLAGRMPAPRAGDHKVVWDAGDLGSGVYLVRLGAGTHTVIRKMLLIR